MRSGGSGVRVLAGELRGRRLRVGSGTRPTEGRVREALFSIWGGETEGAELLDLFAGSGAVGIEALSRGALGVLFVESGRGAVKLLEHNLTALGLGPPRARVLRRRAEDAIRELAATAGGAFDLLFADPPYTWSPNAEFLDRVGELLHAHGSLALEHSARTTMPEMGVGLLRVETRRYGETALTFYRRTASGDRHR